LQYLAEAELGAMLAGRFSAQVAQTLERISPDILHLEQYMDFVRNRQFRETLLCGGGHRPKRALGPQLLEGLALAAPIRPGAGGASLEPGTAAAFASASGLQLSSELPATKAALVILGERWPAAVPLAELAAQALERATPFLGGGLEAARRAMVEDLFQCALCGAVELHTWSGVGAVEVGERPRVGALVAHQASLGPLVVNARHETVALDALGRALVALLDGRRSRRELQDELSRRIADGSLSVLPSAPGDQAQAQGSQALEAAIDEALSSIARCALLTA
jgi:methyltransferase-like protein